MVLQPKEYCYILKCLGSGWIWMIILLFGWRIGVLQHHPHSLEGILSLLASRHNLILRLKPWNAIQLNVTRFKPRYFPEMEGSAKILSPIAHFQSETNLFHWSETPVFAGFFGWIIWNKKIITGV